MTYFIVAGAALIMALFASSLFMLSQLIKSPDARSPQYITALVAIVVAFVGLLATVLTLGLN